jgi:hypothetical protein
MKTFIPTLVIGTAYVAFGLTFENGVPGKAIDADQKDYLDQTAIFVNKTTDGKRIPEPMFKFEEVKAEAPRARARPAADATT